MTDKMVDAWLNGTFSMLNLWLLWHLLKNIWMHDTNTIIVLVFVFFFLTLPIWMISLISITRD